MKNEPSFLEAKSNLEAFFKPYINEPGMDHLKEELEMYLEKKYQADDDDNESADKTCTVDKKGSRDV